MTLMQYRLISVTHLGQNWGQAISMASSIFRVIGYVKDRTNSWSHELGADARMKSDSEIGSILWQGRTALRLRQLRLKCLVFLFLLHPSL